MTTAPPTHPGALRPPGRTAALCAWIEDNLEGFAPHGPSGAPLDRYRAVGELSMALYALSHPGSSLKAWAAAIAERAGARLRRDAAERDWPWIRGEQSVPPFEVAALIPFVLIGGVSGTPAVSDIGLSGQTDMADLARRTPAGGLMDLYLLRTLLGVPADKRPLIGRLTDLRDAAGSGERLRKPGLYDLTHAVFYLTLFGRRPRAVPQDLAGALCAMAGPLALAQMRESDCDLASELLLAHACLGGPRAAAIAEARSLLEAAIEPDGSVPGPPWMRSAGFTPFESAYHTTLVALMALQFDRRSPSCESR